MNATTTSSHFTLHAYRTFTRPLPALRLIFLFVFFILSSRSAMAAEPPNATYPPSRTLSASPALRTSRARNALRPQSDTGWYYADDSRHWYYQLPAQATSPLTTAVRSVSLQTTTARHSNSAATSIGDVPFTSLPTAASITDSLSSAPPSASPPDALDSSSPLLKTGWHHDVDGFTYYFDPSDGHMLAGTHTIDGIEYSFLPERDRGNYHQDSLGTWFYRANGLAPYGSLLFSRSRSDRHATPAATRPANADRDHGLIDSEDLVTDRLTIPPKASPSELTRDDDPDTDTTATPSELPRDEDSTATPSELPREDDSPATPSELPREDDSPATPSEPPRSEGIPPAAPDPDSPDPAETPDPPETPDPERPDLPVPPSDDRHHSHTSDPSVHCIATDDWPTILANRDAYGDCIEYYGPFCSSKPELEQRHSG